jgi:hypothetical protein
MAQVVKLFTEQVQTPEFKPQYCKRKEGGTEGRKDSI